MSKRISDVALPTSDNPIVLPTSSHPISSVVPGAMTLPTFSPTYTVSAVPGAFTLPIFSPTHTVSSSSPHTRLSSAIVSSTLEVYDPVSTATFSQLQTSFSAISVSSNILTAEVFLYEKLRRPQILKLSQILRCYAIWNFQLKIIILPILLTLAVADVDLSRLPGVGYTNAFWPLYTPNALCSANLVVAKFSFKIAQNLGSAVHLYYHDLDGFNCRSNLVDRTNSSDTIGMKGDQQISHRMCHDEVWSRVPFTASAIAFTTIEFTLYQVYWSTGAILGQLVGIAPTIIAVRVGLGRSVSNVENFEVVTPQEGAFRASLLLSQTKGARNGDEEAVEDPHRKGSGSGHTSSEQRLFGALYLLLKRVSERSFSLTELL
ncbi:hypothetical protein B0H14DRAFT_2574348 [Mycena olivaceomarginata]|nr:hypothetical protein B0H14DRAFT_2574348 [Mycena olivaceomarginata]